MTSLDLLVIPVQSKHKLSLAFFDREVYSVHLSVQCTVHPSLSLVSLNPAHDEEYMKQYYLMKFVNNLR